MFQVHTRLVLGDSHSNLVNCIGLSFMPSQFVFLVGFPLGERVLETSHVPFASFHQFHLTELPPNRVPPICFAPYKVKIVTVKLVEVPKLIYLPTLSIIT